MRLIIPFLFYKNFVIRHIDKTKCVKASKMSQMESLSQIFHIPSIWMMVELELCVQSVWMIVQLELYVRKRFVP